MVDKHHIQKKLQRHSYQSHACDAIQGRKTLAPKSRELAPTATQWLSFADACKLNLILVVVSISGKLTLWSRRKDVARNVAPNGTAKKKIWKWSSILKQSSLKMCIGSRMGSWKRNLHQDTTCGYCTWFKRISHGHLISTLGYIIAQCAFHKSYQREDVLSSIYSVTTRQFDARCAYPTVVLYLASLPRGLCEE
jgi:hypothetical protein